MQYNLCSCTTVALPLLYPGVTVRSETTVYVLEYWLNQPEQLFDTGLIEIGTFNMLDVNTSKRMNAEIKVANKNTGRCISGIYFNRHIKVRELTSFLSHLLSQFLQDLFKLAI